jgi:hypothetical protein
MVPEGSQDISIGCVGQRDSLARSQSRDVGNPGIPLATPSGLLETITMIMDRLDPDHP